MKADFLDAHDRHWEDAEMLFAAKRFANADHLYGIAAECGLKRLMLSFGMPVDPSTGSPHNSDHRKHANILWANFESYRSGKVEGTGYALNSPNPFSSWDVSDRYAHQSNFDLANTQRHQAGALEVRNLIRKAKRVGLL